MDEKSSKQNILHYGIDGCVKEAYLSGMTQRNITHGIASTGIYPNNKNVFDESELAPSQLSDGPNQSKITHQQKVILPIQTLRLKPKRLYMKAVKL